MHFRDLGKEADSHSSFRFFVHPWVRVYFGLLSFESCLWGVGEGRPFHGENGESSDPWSSVLSRDHPFSLGQAPFRGEADPSKARQKCHLLLGGQRGTRTAKRALSETILGGRFIHARIAKHAGFAR